VITEVPWEQVTNYLPEETKLMLVNSSSAQVNHVDRLMANTAKQRKQLTTVASDLSQLLSVKLGMIDCSTTDTALLVSSGLSADAYKFATSHDGKLISFPVIEGKHVMNTAVSASVALFEIARQLRLRANFCQ